VGGRTGGEKISIVGEEWGQDMVRLGTALQQHGVQHLRFNVDTFTSTLELARFGVTVERLGCPRTAPGRGWLAVNARDNVRTPECSSWLAGKQPEFVVNNHVFVYRLQ